MNWTGSRQSVATALVALAALGLGACYTLSPSDHARLAAIAPELGQFLLVGFTGVAAEDNAELDDLVCVSRVGGVLIFSRNIVDAAQLAALTSALQARARACAASPLLVAVDAEGGQVMRLGPDAGYEPTPSAEELGGANDLAMTELEARRIGSMLRGAGINWNLAPVVDVGYNPANPVIVGANRSFSANPDLVTHHARAFIRGMRKAGLLTALKHFPGHGSSWADSHRGFVDVTDTADPERELAPYRTLITEAMADSVMTAHVVNRRLDRRHPATLSRATISGLLRGELAWDGLVVSDDLRMRAIEQRYGLEEAVVLALKAGVDVLLIADDLLPDGRSAASVARGAVRAALEDGRLALDRAESALRRIRALKARL